MFEIVQFDVCGVCNARCAWCYTGRRNRSCTATGGAMMSPELFRRTIRHLRDGGFLAPNGWLGLYMWGDPFLHPQIRQLMSIAHEEQVRVGLSTNGSTRVFFDEPGVLSNVRHIWFSMPGFSQHSYDKAHGFHFETIRQNIADMTRNFYEVGGLRPGGVLNIFHMYQYNLLEIPEAFAFSQQTGAQFWPYAAYIADYGLLRDYLTGNLPYEVLDKAGKELFLTLYDRQLPETGIPQCRRQLHLDEYANAVVCCHGKHIRLGSIFDMGPEDYMRAKAENEQAAALCRECQQLKICWLAVLQMSQLMPPIVVS